MGRLWKQNWKIAAGTSPTLADEPGEVLTFGQQVVGALASGDIVGGNGIDVVSSGTGVDEVLVISVSSGVGGGTGNITGPGSSTDGALAVWVGTSGNELGNSVITINSSDQLVTPSGIINNGAVVNNVTFFPTSPASAGDLDYFCILTGAGAFSFTLPASPVTGRTVVVKDGVGDALTFNKTILPDTGTIDNQANAILAASGASLSFIYDGTEWKAF